MKPETATQAIEAERAQIGHEVHDALIPLIFAASAYLQSHLESLGEDDLSRIRIGQANDLLADALQTARTILTRAYPPELETQHWTSAVRHTITSLVGDAEVDWELSDESFDYSRPVAAAAYRIIVEATRNAALHGIASKISIVATASRIEIKDNGKGFDPNSVAEDRYGIRSMKGRAKLVGGRLSVESTAGGPTTVVFDLNDE